MSEGFDIQFLNDGGIGNFFISRTFLRAKE